MSQNSSAPRPAILPPIVLYPHQALRQPTAEVKEVTNDTRAILHAMLAAMEEANGIGLAAPQINVLQRLIVVLPQVEGEPGKRKAKIGIPPLLMVNPTVLDKSPERIDSEEGCLSFPTLFATIQRHAWVKVGYQDQDGTPQTLEAEGLLGRCIQHEIDHLQGVMFFDHLSRLKRDLLLKKYTKLYPTIQDDIDYPVQK